MCYHARVMADRLIPRISSAFWTVAGDPDLGDITNPIQQPVDFAVWQAADGTWQLWSCIRGTDCGGMTRLLHRWEGSELTDSDWIPKGVAMQADPDLGETPGGLQTPHVVRHEGRYIMFYGDWENICLATSPDGKVFVRRLTDSGTTGMFTEGPGNNTRDPMAILIDGVWHCYYTAFPEQKGAVYCSPDPMDFGIEDDRYLLGKLPIAAPEIVGHEGKWYVACLLPSLKGIRIARIEWAAL
jgi:hypothetical protein